MARIPPIVPVLSRRRALGAIAAGLLVLGGCAGTKVRAERYPGFDLESAKTYAWITDDLVLIDFGEAQPRERTKENEQLIRAAVDRELVARGFELVAAEEADVLVAFSVGLRTRYRLEGGPGTAISMDGPGETQTEGTLNVYLIDRVGSDHEVFREVWHGWATKPLDPSDDAKTVIDQAVSRIMAVYPGAAP